MNRKPRRFYLVRNKNPKGTQLTAIDIYDRAILLDYLLSVPEVDLSPIKEEVSAMRIHSILATARYKISGGKPTVSRSTKLFVEAGGKKSMKMGSCVAVLDIENIYASAMSLLTVADWDTVVFNTDLLMFFYFLHDAGIDSDNTDAIESSEMADEYVRQNPMALVLSNMHTRPPKVNSTASSLSDHSTAEKLSDQTTKEMK